MWFAHVMAAHKEHEIQSYPLDGSDYDTVPDGDANDTDTKVDNIVITLTGTTGR